MMMARLSIIVALAMTIAGAARAEVCEALPTTFDYGGFGPEVELSIDEIATLPPHTVLLAGRYVDAANTLHPALMVSEDGGRTWTSVSLLLPGAGLGRLRTHGPSHAWGIVSFRQEGLDLPEYVLRSRDAGRSWCRVPLADLATLNAVESFRFFDSRHGLIVFTEAPFGTGETVYHTADGGEHWLPLWPSRTAPAPGIETDFVYPEATEPPPHAPLWRQDLDFFPIDGVLRIRPEDGHYVVERHGFDGDPSWIELSRIARFHRIADGELGP